MFLKSLEIFGFKSFADRTFIEFSPGITALLGPNGCGKSNVVDAIKWVVGEQSPRSLRADSMEDVIFNGTETRKALSVAEVTLTISNEAGALPLDVQEVAIRRRLYRSGESEYYINGQAAKLREVRELFWDTGIGKSAYSVMEQGKIDQILSSKPEDRRYLFEEAAGITKHKVRVREAETKLQRTEDNMLQIGNILAEVKRSHDSLKHQAEKTNAYRSLKDRIFRTELDVYLLRLRQFVRDKERKEAEFASKRKERDEVKAESERLGESMAENLDQVNGMESSLVEMQKTLYGLAVEKNGKEKHRGLLNDRNRELRSKIDQLNVRRQSILDKIEGLREEEDEKDAELAGYKSRLKETEKRIAEFEANIRAAGLAVRTNDEEAGKCREAIGLIEESIEEDRLRLDDITEAIVEQLDARLKECGYSSAQRLSLEEEILSLTRAIGAKASGKARLFEDLKKAAGFGGERMAECIGRLEGSIGDLDEISAMAKSLGVVFGRYRLTTPSFLDEFLSPEGIMTKKRAIDASIAASSAQIDSLKGRISELDTDSRDLGQKIDQYRRTLEDSRLARTGAQAQMEAAQQALAVFRREIAGQEATLREHEDEIYAESRKLEDLAGEIEQIESELAEIEEKGKSLSAEMDRLERGIAERNADLAQRKKESARLAEKLQGIQAELETINLFIAQNETEIRNLKENFQDQYSRDLSEFEDRMLEIRSPLSELKEYLASIKAQLRNLGSVNLMAPEEYKEVKERYDFLSGQLADLEKARDDLRKITVEIRDESAQLFLETYNRIKKNFHNMFRRLFGGGRAELRLADTDHVLETGIEILAQPPGKKLEVISLLSGGERTLTAIALLFATYMVKPSPFCFLDEIDAALDEANVIRFINLLREFSRTSQFILITHNKKTVSGANALLGVTMEESGITKAIAIRLEHKGEGETTVALEGDSSFEEEDVEYEEGRQVSPEGGARQETVDA